MDLKQMKEVVFDANLELVRRQLVIYTWGNVSLIDRENKLIVIKPRGIEYDDMVADDMSVVDYEGNLIHGSKLLPSVDLDIHIAIFNQFPDVQSIAHTHSTYATSFAQARKSIPCMGTTHADHFYGDIPCTRALTKEETASDYEKNTGDVIVEHFLQNKIDPMQVFGVLVAGHGPFTWGATTTLAVENSVILEELSKMAILTKQVNADAPHLEDYALDKHFLRKHGKDSYFYQSK